MRKIISVDLDGTLINGKNEIIGGEKTLNILNELKEDGYSLVINTGRLDHDIDIINKRYDLDVNCRISQNGAVIQGDGELNVKLIDKNEALDIYKYIKESKLRIELNTASNRYWKSDRDPDFPKEFYDSSIIRADFTDVIKYQPVVLFLLIGDESEINKVQTYVNENCTKIKAIKTSKSSLEILNVNVSKGNALLEIFKDNEIISIGDSENDFSMFDISNKFYYVGEDTCFNKENNVDSIYEALKEIKEAK